MLPRGMDRQSNQPAAEIADFPTELALTGHVVAGIQNQAVSAAVILKRIPAHPWRKASILLEKVAWKQLAH